MKCQLAKESFKAAAAAAAFKGGFIQDKALIHELAGSYYLKKGDNYWVDRV